MGALRSVYRLKDGCLFRPLLAWTILFGLLSACAPVSGPSPAETILGIEAPPVHLAGEPLTIRVRTEPGATSVVLTVIGTAGIFPLAAPVNDGVAHILLPPAVTDVSGLTQLIAGRGEGRLAVEMNIQPGPPRGPLKIRVGAKTIIADGASTALAVIVPADALGNPVAAGTPLTLRASRPDGRQADFELETAHLLAWQRLVSGTRAGRTRLSVVSAGAYGPEAVLEEVAGWPLPFALRHVPAVTPADGRSLVTLRTEPLVDRFGNLLPDGTLVTFVANGSDGRVAYYPGQTIDGVAQTTLPAPSTPDAVRVTANVFGVSSFPHEITFTEAAAVGPIPLRLVFDAALDTWRIMAGPVLGPEEQFSPDGTALTITITRLADDQMVFAASAPVVAGFGTLNLPLRDLSPGRYRIDAAAGAAAGHLTVRWGRGER